MGRSKRGGSHGMDQVSLQRRIYDFLRSRPRKKYAAKILKERLRLKNSKDSINDALSALERKGLVKKNRSKKYSLNSGKSRIVQSLKPVLKQGMIEITMSGAGYVVVSPSEEDIYIPKKNLAGAMHRDEVEVELLQHGRFHKPRGRVTRVLKRYRSSFIGLFQEFQRNGYVFVDDGRNVFDVHIQPEDYQHAESGDVVIAEVYDFGREPRHKRFGRVKTILNPSNMNEFEWHAILVKNGFDVHFPPDVLEESKKLSFPSIDDILSERMDFRDVLTVTIDPDDAKDFDDALSIRRGVDGITEVGVHIADVTHYVGENTALDKEAFKRGTSVYMVGSVCPMLPERISNELCSLRPGEDKLCFSVLFRFDEKHRIVGKEYKKTVIHSDRRFTYGQVQTILDGEDDTLSEELKLLNAIARKLRSQRFKKGSVDFQSDEISIQLDDQGFPSSIGKKERFEAHTLIEEYMLLANKAVAEKMSSHPFIYRIHDNPDPEKILELAMLANEFGISLSLDTPKAIKASLNSLDQHGLDEETLSIVRSMAIRSMAKAVYSSENIGHFGLGFQHYTHFTSPIRRYSDVIAHRMLEKLISGHPVRGIEKLESRCKYISARERAAVDAERESVKVKQMEYLSKKVGGTFTGTVRGMIDRGIFVELHDSRADGLVGFETLGESYSMHPARIKAVGNNSGRIIRIGEVVKVKLNKVDVGARRIELALVEPGTDS